MINSTSFSIEKIYPMPMGQSTDEILPMPSGQTSDEVKTIQAYSSIKALLSIMNANRMKGNKFIIRPKKSSRKKAWKVKKVIVDLDNELTLER